MKLRAKIYLVPAMLLAVGIFCRAHAQPSLSPPVPLSNDVTHAQLTLSNCTNTTLNYVLQTSADLTSWSNIQQTYAVFSNQSVTISTTNQQSFYRLVTNPAPIFQAAFVTASNVNIKGNGCVIDSFDSGSPLYSTGGQYDINKRKARGNVYSGGVITNGITVQNVNIWGKAMTGPGTTKTNVGVGSQGAVGDAAWNGSQHGIEPGYWSGGFAPTIPDVTIPNASAILPAPSNSIIYLTSGAYLADTAPTNQINISGNVTLWVTTNYSPNISFSTTNPNTSLVLYVGTTNSLNTNSLNLANNGVLNYPGFARNFQIYGLPSLTSIAFAGNAAVVATIYAPEATVSGGGGGNNNADVAGAIVAKFINGNGHWNFHYDESLATNGPTF